MTLRILNLTEEDLLKGYAFYEIVIPHGSEGNCANREGQSFTDDPGNFSERISSDLR